MMKVLSLSDEPFHILPFWNAGRGGVGPFIDSLPIHIATVDRLPEGFSVLIATSDLQGRDDHMGAPGQLLGEVVPSFLREIILPGIGFPKEAKVGALLAGDFYALPTLEKRGGTGDVQTVWAAFANAFDQVIGIPGNHDLFEGKTAPSSLSQGATFLDGTTAMIGDLKVAGLGGIIGRPTRPGKPHRRQLEVYLEILDQILKEKPDILLSHEGPGGEDHTQSGLPGLQKYLVAREISLVIRGHSHWEKPLTEIAGKLQVLNVDQRVVILSE